MIYLFYRCAKPISQAVPALPSNYSLEMWAPGMFRVKPEGISVFPFTVWWLFHRLHVFSNGDYGLLVIRQGTRVVHRSVITPGYLRFPFMAIEDIQVGDTWTDPEFRGKGLATLALEAIMRRLDNQDRTCWYVVEADNAPSIRVVEKAGFVLAGRGVRTRPFGLGLLGQFQLTDLSSTCSS